MQKLAVILAMGLFACATPPPPAPVPAPQPVIMPKPPSEPFGALLETRSEDYPTRRQFKDHFLHAFSAADSLDGKVDGSAPITESCKEQVALCRESDRNGDGRLSLKEFLDKVDELFDRAVSKAKTLPRSSRPVQNQPPKDR